MLDFRGVEIRVGSTIVYPGRQGSSIWLNAAEVVRVEDAQLRVRVTGNSEGVTQNRLTTLTAVDRVAVVA